jgi:putative endonuclease
MPAPKCCVYVPRSLRERTRYYTGVTSSLHDRLAAHNAGRSPHTADGTPWARDHAVRASDQAAAAAISAGLESRPVSGVQRRHRGRSRTACVRAVRTTPSTRGHHGSGCRDRYHRVRAGSSGHQPTVLAAGGGGSGAEATKVTPKSKPSRPCQMTRVETRLPGRRSTTSSLTTSPLARLPEKAAGQNRSPESPAYNQRKPSP